MLAPQPAHKQQLAGFGIALLVSLSACTESLEDLSKKEGTLGADAKVLIAALAKTKIAPRDVKVAKNSHYAKYSDQKPPRAAVVHYGGRIAEVYVEGAAVDLKLLAKLDALTWLAIENAPTMRLEGLANLKQLRYLDLRGSKVTHIIGLKNLPALRQLKLHTKALKVVSGIENVGLAKLDFSRCGKLERLEGLANLSRLTHLDASGNKLRSLRVTNLAALTHLDLSNNRLTALPALPGAKKLKQVKVGSNRIRTLAGLDKLLTKELYLERNQLTDLDPTSLEKRPPLGKSGAEEDAKAGARSPAGAPPPPGVTTAAGAASGPPIAKLVTLAVDRNKLASLAGIQRYPNLQYLYLSYNRLTSLDGIQWLKKLKKLRVAHNGLKTLAPLKADKLAELIATDNQIAAASDLFGPTGKRRPHIARYDLRRNALTGIAAARLFHGLTGPSYRGSYTPPGYYSSGGGMRSTGSRYSSGGGYRYGK